jgi:hypothetical protein
MLGASNEGVLHVGRFTRPTDGREFLVADWRDIDDASETLYFTRRAGGLELAIEQLNG